LAGGDAERTIASAWLVDEAIDCGAIFANAIAWRLDEERLLATARWVLVTILR